jgi:hypothetical protein
MIVSASAFWHGCGTPPRLGSVLQRSPARLIDTRAMSSGAGASPPERERPTWTELQAAVADLPPARAAHVLARARPAPRTAPPETPGTLPPPLYASWDDYLATTTRAERRRWCAAKAKKANAPRLMSGHPVGVITADDGWAVLESAQGRCTHCGSLAVEKRPSMPGGSPAPWEHVGRRIGSLGHRISRFQGGMNDRENLAWSCLWCNTWPDQRVRGALDHGGYFPAKGASDP